MSKQNVRNTAVAVLLIISLLAIEIINVAKINSSEIPVSLGRTIWHDYDNPSKHRDVAYSVCGYGDWIYVVGSEGVDVSFSIPRIEKRSKINGEIISVWRGDILGEFRDCVVIGNRVYSVGYKVLNQGGRTWILAALDLNLTSISLRTWTEFRYWSEAVSVISDGENIYVVGLIGSSSEDTMWRVEKLSQDLITLLVYESNPSRLHDMLTYSEINPITNELWVVGINGENSYWRIEVIDRNLTLRHKFEEIIPGFGLPNAVTFDEAGSAYVAGAGIAIFNSKAELLNVTTTFGYCPKLIYLNNILYLFCTAMIERFNRHILYVIDRETFTAFLSILSLQINAYAYFANGKIYADEHSIYVAGSVELEDSGGWIIYNVEKVPKQIIIEYTITEPHTTVVSMIVSFRDMVRLAREKLNTSTQQLQTKQQTEQKEQSTYTETSQIPQQSIVPPINYEVLIIIVIITIIALVLFVKARGKK